MNNILERFSAESIEIFTNNNITGNVKMSAEDIESILIREGYEILDVVKNFFELCGHFQISFIWDKKNDIYCKLIVDPIGYADSDDRMELLNVFNKNLCPLAYLSWGGQLMIDEEENMYLFEDGDLDFLGSTLVAGIEEIFKGNKWRLHPLNKID
jgi:hypothetical protein